MALFSLITVGGNWAVWMELIKGMAATITVLIGAPTAILICCYWAIKVRNAWINRDKNDV